MDKQLIIVGASLAGKTIASLLLERSSDKIVGFADEGSQAEGVIKVSNGNGGCELPILGSSSDLISLVKKHSADSVILALSNGKPNQLLSQIVKCYEASIEVQEMADLYTHIAKKVPVHHVGREWIVPNLTAPPHDFYTLFHDATNYILSLVGLVCVLPFFPIVGLAIKIDSRGPIFYRQIRVGKNSRPFRLIKFRTMVKDADQNGDAWTHKNDSRITRVGRWLRKFRLDELPQLINVLRGDMGLIGPRPDAIDLVAQFRKEIPFYDYRHLVRPGISGWAQVNYENTCTVEGALEKIQFDLYWIKNRSFWLDLKIIFKSIKVMLTGYGAV
jgi:exopolysaccharide biosynthesis polyprenyl glycosylphosphotransferase